MGNLRDILEVSVNKQTEWREPKRPGRKKQSPSSNPIGSVNIKRSELEKMHRIRERMSGDGALIPLWEALKNVIDYWEEYNQK